MKIKLLLSAVLISLLFACNKDEELINETPNNGSSNKSFRLKQATSYSGSSAIQKSDYIYLGDKLVNATTSRKDDSGNWIEYFKTDISYSGDSRTLKGFTKDASTWAFKYKIEYLTQNSLIVESRTYFEENNLEDFGKRTYQYSGSNITSWQNYAYDYSSKTNLISVKGENVYVEEKLIESKTYQPGEPDSWYQVGKEIYTYNGNNLENWVGYLPSKLNNWIEYKKRDYIYSGENVSQLDYFDWDKENNQWVSTDKVTYKYNSEGYLIEEQSNSKKITYEYEEGVGNAKSVFSDPASAIYGRPTIKNASLDNISSLHTVSSPF